MRVAFCGIGALGSNAVVLCRNFDAELQLIDFDRVESKNLLAQAFVKPSLGKNKADAMKLQLHSLWGVKAASFPVRVVKDNVDALLEHADLVVDAVDNQATRLLLSEYCRRTNKALVHAALSGDGTFGLVRWDARFIPDKEDDDGQATCEGGAHLPLIGQVAAALARAVQDWLSARTERDVIVSLGSVFQTH